MLPEDRRRFLFRRFRRSSRDCDAPVAVNDTTVEDCNDDIEPDAEDGSHSTIDQQTPLERIKSVLRCFRRQGKDSDKSLPLDNDIFSLIFLAKLWTPAYFYGLGIALLQLLVYGVGVYNTLQKTNQCDIKVNVSVEVQIFQAFAMILPIYTIDDIAKTFPMLLIPNNSKFMVNDKYIFGLHKSEDTEQDIAVVDWPAEGFDYIRRWRISIMLKGLICVLVYYANIILILASSTLVDLLVNFTIFHFVLSWGTIALKVADYNLLPGCISRQIKELRTVKTKNDDNEEGKEDDETFSVMFSDYKWEYNKKDSSKTISTYVLIFFFIFFLAADICLFVLRHGYKNELFLGWNRSCDRCYRLNVEFFNDLSTYSGYYMECGQSKLRPVYKRRGREESLHGTFHYSEKQEAWVFTDQVQLATSSNSNDAKIFSLDRVLFDGIDIKCIERKTNIERKKLNGECNRDEFIDDVSGAKYSSCNTMIHFDATGQDFIFTLLKNNFNKTVTTYERPIFYGENDINSEIILYTGQRWYHLSIKKANTSSFLLDTLTDGEFIDQFHKNYFDFKIFLAMLKNGEFPYQWDNTLMENTKFYSEVTDTDVPTGIIQWFKIDSTEDYPPLSDGSIPYNSTFQCSKSTQYLPHDSWIADGDFDGTRAFQNLDVIDCSIPNTCQNGGTCLEDQLLIDNGYVLNPYEEKICTPTMKEYPHLTCGSKCLCDYEYMGIFCEEMSTWEPTDGGDRDINFETPWPSNTFAPFTSDQSIQVQFSSIMYTFSNEINLTKHLMTYNNSYTGILTDNFNLTTPPVLDYSHFSGMYVKTGLYGTPVYYEQGNQQSVHGFFYYCKIDEAWVFTILPLALSDGVVPDVTKTECGNYGWLMRSPRTKELSLDMAPSTGWTVWTGNSVVTNSDLSITPVNCFVDTDCSIVNGRCEGLDIGTNLCKCNGGFEGLFCESDKPCNEIVMYNGTFYDVTLNNEPQKKIHTELETMYGPFSMVKNAMVHDRHIFVWNNTKEIQLILYSGSRWYHTIMKHETYNINILNKIQNETFHLYWDNIFETYTQYYSEITKDYVPIGNHLQWFQINKFNNPSSNINNNNNNAVVFDESIKFNQRFECLSIDCSIRNICGLNGECIDNIKLVNTDGILEDHSSTIRCNNNDEMNSSNVICGGKCECDSVLYAGHFCETRPVVS